MCAWSGQPMIGLKTGSLVLVSYALVARYADTVTASDLEAALSGTSAARADLAGVKAGRHPFGQISATVAGRRGQPQWRPVPRLVAEKPMLAAWAGTAWGWSAHREFVDYYFWRARQRYRISRHVGKAAPNAERVCARLQMAQQSVASI
jgi:hypothetical protein